MPTRVGVLIVDDFTDSGLSVALDVLRASNELRVRAGRAAPFVIEVLTSAPTKVVRAASSLRVTADGGLRRLAGCQVVLVPGCWVDGEAGVSALLKRPQVLTLIDGLRLAGRRGALVGASCTGTFLLAATGLLEGRVATTTWWLAESFRVRFPGVKLEVEQALTIDGSLLCGGSVFAMADLALAIVARYGGPSLARACMRVLLLDRHASQAPYMVLRQMVQDDPVLRAAERWVRAHLGEQQVSVEALARGVGTSPRTFARRLATALDTTPLAFIQRLRLDAATHLLETTQQSLDEVAHQVGYRDAGTLRRLIRRTLGTSPGDLRSHRRRPSARW